MSSKPLNSLLLAAVLGMSSTAVFGNSEQETQRELEAARSELEQARQELERATRKLTEAYGGFKELGKVDRALEFWSNPDRAMLGVIIGPGPLRGDKFVGTAILAVTPGSGAEQAGLQAGDLIVAIDGSEVEADADTGSPPEHALGNVMGILKPDQKVKVEYERVGKRRSTTVIAKRQGEIKGEMPSAFQYFFKPCDCNDDVIRRFETESMPPSISLSQMSPPKGLLGLELAAMNKDLASYFDTDHGVLVVKAPSEGTLNLRSGDVIIRVDGSPTEDPRLALDKLRAIADDADVVVDVMRRGKHLKLKGTLPPMAQARQRQKEVHIIIDKSDD